MDGSSQLISFAKFWSRVDIPIRGKWRDKCWMWAGAIKRGSNPKSKGCNGGYGALIVDGGYKQAHRYSYEIIHGEIGAGLVIDHTCCNRACVNPRHLQAVTQKQNVNLAQSRGRRRIK